MEIFLAELVGTMILVILGDGVVANVVLSKTKGNNAGWIAITTGWGLAVAIGVYSVGRISGAHLNPAVTLALASVGDLDTGLIGSYLGGQLLGAFLGAIVVFLAYQPHWKATKSPEDKLAVFSTGPAIRSQGWNLVTEAIGTAVLVFGVLAIAANAGTMNGDLAAVFSNGINPLLVGALVWGIGLSLGGPTGYAINPARDLGPRIAHAILPIHGKGSSDWDYAWVPVVGPIVGGIVGAMAFKALEF